MQLGARGTVKKAEGGTVKSEYYKVSGRFEAYNRHKTLLTDQFFINKIFEAVFPRTALNMAVAHMKRRVVKKYGKGATVNQISNLKVEKSHAPVKKKKERENTLQGKLF